MTDNYARSFTRVLRDWLEEEDGNPARLAEFVIGKALGGHFGFFKMVIELKDGPVDPESVPGRIFPDDHALVIVDGRQNVQRAKVA
jgi:hypothetical protein